MPDFFTHTIFGLRVKDWLHTPVKENLYHFANQGPDFFFYSDFYPWKRKKRGKVYGELLHQILAKETLLEALTYARDNYNDAIGTYIFGWINHYTLDAMTHPYVREKEALGIDHKEIEMAIDQHVIERFRFLPRYGPDLIAIDEQSLDNVADIYQHVLSTLYQKNPPKGLIKASYEDFVTYQKLFHDTENEKKKRLLQWVARLFSINLNEHYAGVTLEDLAIDDIERFDQAFDDAVLLAAERLQAAEKFLDHKIDLEEVAAYFKPINYEGHPY